MIIHSQRERDRLTREQQKQLEENHRQRTDALDELEAVWQASRDHNQDVIDRTTRGIIDINFIELDDDDYSTIPLPIINGDDVYFAVDD